jgi:acyl-coenzyme A thioesterase PaaI-like protein
VAVPEPAEVGVRFVVALGGVVGVTAGVVAVAADTAGACAWKDRIPAVPATVADRTMGDRRIWLSL